MVAAPQDREHQVLDRHQAQRGEREVEPQREREEPADGERRRQDRESARRRRLAQIEADRDREPEEWPEQMIGHEQAGALPDLPIGLDMPRNEPVQQRIEQRRRWETPPEHLVFPRIDEPSEDCRLTVKIRYL